MNDATTLNGFSDFHTNCLSNSGILAYTLC